MRQMSPDIIPCFAALAFVSCSVASPLQARDTTTTAASAATSSSSSPTAGLVETTINGKATTLQVSIPTGDASQAASKTTATDVSSTQSLSTSPTASIGDGSGSLLTCSRRSGNPICSPTNGTIVHVDNTYYVTWDPTRFGVNTTITILLNYANDSSNGNRAAWTSEGTPKQKGFVTVQMLDSWRQNTNNVTLQFGLVSYTPVSEHTAKPLDGPTVFLSKAPTQHYPPPAKTKLPDHLSLFIGVPLGVGALLFVLLGLFFGMRKHRQIGLGNVMGRRQGYGARKSRRQRMGIKKGAIRLEERELSDPDHEYRDDQIRPAPRPGEANWRMPSASRGHAKEESLGSLVSAGNGGGNAFRTEIEKQRGGR